MKMVMMKEKRISKGLTQDELAKRINIRRAAYAHYETGRRSPRPEILKRIAQALDCSVDDILKDPNKEGSNE